MDMNSGSCEGGHLLGGVGHGGGGGDLDAGAFDDLAALVDVGAFQAHHQRHFQVHFAGGVDQPFGDHVAAHDAAEYVDEDRLELLVPEHDLERLGHLFGGGAAADVEKVGRLGAVQLDDVHGGH